MNSKEESVAFANGDKRQVSKKTCYALAFLAVLCCVLVGCLVYYVTHQECQNALEKAAGAQKDPSGGGGGGGGGKGGGGKSKTYVKHIRLPNHLEALHYRVHLVPFIIPDNYTIRGEVVITLRCHQGGDNITVHQADMVLDNSTIWIKEVNVDTGEEKDVDIAEHEYDAEREFYVARLSSGYKTVPGREYKMGIKFVAQLSDRLKGFYRSVYRDEGGKDVTIATTQFQSTDARRAFPCLDEPALKARFEVSLGRLKNMSSISNMPQREKGAPMEGTSEYVWDHYNASVPMSTYLVAFVVSDFEFEISPPPKEGNLGGKEIEFRIWARKNALDQVEFAKTIGAEILAYFEKFFDVAYPLPKQDMIAIPDFSAGAMENWGLITYRETALLYKEGVSSLFNKQRIAVVISHELAHQWFGNLVTPSWWTDLWLNEGFASYVEYLGVVAVVPEMGLMEQFVTLDMHPVMNIDALATSHPISIPVGHPKEINEIFDRISYAKGASIIRMMDHFLTTEENPSFRKGLTNYLNAFAFKAAEQDDLWRHLTEQAHLDGTLGKGVTVKQIMDTWTLQMGYPVINVERNYDQGTATLTQERFLFGAADPEDTHEYKWHVPVTYAVPGRSSFNDTFAKTWLTPDGGQVKVSGLPDRDTPVVFNVQQTGYYRVNYDRKNWDLLIDALRSDHESIHVINRAQIVDDAFNLARAALLDYDVCLGLTSYLDEESHYVPWATALNGIGYIDVMLRRTPAYGEFKRYMRTLIRPAFARLGFGSTSSSHLDVFLRTRIVGWACKLKMEECTEKAAEMYKRWMDQLRPDEEGANTIDANLKRQVYCNAISNGGEDEWDFGWERYQASNVGSEKSNLLSALSCTSELWLLNRYLNMSLTPGSGLRKQDGGTVISNIASNDHGRDLAFDFVRNKFDNVLDYYGGTSFALAGVMKNVLKNRNTRFDVDELKRFIDDNRSRLDTGERAAVQSVEKGEANIAWMDRNYETIFEWLKKANGNEKRQLG